MRREEKRLLELFGKLAQEQQETLIAFAEFLVSRTTSASDTMPTQPLQIERPAQETVVMAIKRLTRTYPMLDRRKLMGETSTCMAEHALKGRAATEVIDELELVFARHYKKQVQSAE